MYLEISGNFDLGANLPTNAELLNLERIWLSVDTSGAPCNITLPAISNIPRGLLNLQIYVNDRTGNAGTNNITVTAAGADSINNAATAIMNLNGDGMQIFITDKNDWRTGSAGSGSGTPLIVGSLNVDSTIVGQPFVADVPFPAATANQAYRITMTPPQDKGMIGGVGGANGLQVEEGDIIYALVNTASGTFAAVGANWTVWEGEELQLWDNGTAAAPNSIRQINQASPNTASGQGALVKGAGNSVVGSGANGVLTADNNEVGGTGNTVDGSNGNGANNNRVNGDSNIVVDTIGPANNNQITGDTNTVDSSSQCTVCGDSNNMTDVNGTTVCGNGHTLTGSINNADDNIVGGATNQIQDLVAAGSRNTINGNTNLIQSASDGVAHGANNLINQGERANISGEANTIDGSNGNGAQNNNVTGQGNTVVDTTLPAIANTVTGSGNTIDSGQHNIVGGDSNTIDGSIGNGCDNNHVIGSSNTISDTNAASTNNAISGTGNTVDSSALNIVSGTANIINDATGSTSSANTVNGVSNNLTNGGAQISSNVVNGNMNIISNGEGPDAADNNLINGDANELQGVSNASMRGHNGLLEFPTRNTYECLASGSFAANGDAQVMRAVAKAQTTDATTTALLVEGNALTIPAGFGWNIHIELVATQTGGIAGSVGDGGFASASVFAVNIAGTVTVPNKLINSAFTGLIGVVDIDPNGVGNDVEIQVTGEADKNVNWVAEVTITQTQFA